MQPDVALVAGLVLLLLAVPSLVSAFSESRPPRMAAVLGVAGGALVAFAVSESPGGYAPGDLPEVVTRVIGRILR